MGCVRHMNLPLHYVSNCVRVRTRENATLVIEDEDVRVCQCLSSQLDQMQSNKQNNEGGTDPCCNLHPHRDIYSHPIHGIKWLSAGGNG